MRASFRAISYLGCLLAGLLAGVAFADGGDALDMPAQAPFLIDEVAPGVFVHPGRHVHLDSPHRDDIANSGFVVGEACVAVIDPGGSVEQGKRLRAAIMARTDRPICLVFNTHVHFDHLIGSAAFAPDLLAGAELVGHRDLGEAIEENQAFFAESFAPEMDAGEGTAVILPLPDVGVADTQQFDLGQRRLTATAHAAAHSRTDLTVFDERTRALFTGDLVFRSRIPALDGSLPGWRDALRRLDELPVAVWIPGHGAVTSDSAAALAPVNRYLSVLEREVRESIAEGRALAEAKSLVGQEEALKWLLADENHARNISRAFRELEWE